MSDTSEPKKPIVTFELSNGGGVLLRDDHASELILTSQERERLLRLKRLASTTS